uniref:Secreted protein n=1 Tax=Ascaris lumbricoides TaxID=6252 RepID=A0A0M3HMI5_ASCLU
MHVTCSSGKQLTVVSTVVLTNDSDRSENRRASSTTTLRLQQFFRLLPLRHIARKLFPLLFVRVVGAG